eukprot:TRINITY_DN61444_c0_g1_i1.p1 TRINITY_DN61444_c0_g1~~TRINITY_DN61444_c0_g1_i1.p1  ORF type:complete len:535 (+),score=56.11 TRINITY_DN61444_c0_g1_i1:88-1692(+)
MFDAPNRAALDTILGVAWAVHVLCSGQRFCVHRAALYECLVSFKVALKNLKRWVCCGAHEEQVDPIEKLVGEELDRIRIANGRDLASVISLFSLILGHVLYAFDAVLLAKTHIGDESASVFVNPALTQSWQTVIFARIGCTVTMFANALNLTVRRLYAMYFLLTFVVVARLVHFEDWTSFVSYAMRQYVSALAFGAAVLDYRISAVTYALGFGVRAAIAWKLVDTIPGPADERYGALQTQVVQELVVSLMSLQLLRRFELSTREHVRTVLNGEVEGKAAKVEIRSIWCLLGSLSDAVVRLNESFEITGRARRFSGLIISGQAKAEGTTFTDYMDVADRKRFEEFVATNALFADGLDDEDATMAPVLHVNLKDTLGLCFAADIFHVRFANTDGSIAHLIGVRESGDSRGGRVAPLQGGVQTGSEDGTDAEVPSPDVISESYVSTTSSSCRSPFRDGGIAPMQVPSLMLEFSIVQNTLLLSSLQACFRHKGAGDDALRWSLCPACRSIRLSASSSRLEGSTPSSQLATQLAQRRRD